MVPSCLLHERDTVDNLCFQVTGCADAFIDLRTDLTLFVEGPAAQSVSDLAAGILRNQTPDNPPKSNAGWAAQSVSDLAAKPYEH